MNGGAAPLARRRPWSALAALAVLLAASGLALFVSGTPWAGEWAWTFDMAAGSTTLTAPVVAAIAAWGSARARVMAALVDSSPNGWQTSLRVAAAAWLLAMTALAACTAVAVAVTMAGPHGGRGEWLSLLHAALILAVFALAGATAGRYAPHLVVVALTAPAAFVVAALGASGFGPKFLRVDAATGSMAGLRLDPLAAFFQGLALVGVMLVLLAALLHAGRRATRPAVVATLGALGALILVVGLVALRGDHDFRYATSAEVATDCAGEQPRVCALPSHVRAVDQVRPHLSKMFAQLVEAGIDVPDEFRELAPGQEPDTAQDSAQESAGNVLGDAGWLVLDGGPSGPQAADPAVATAAATASMPAACSFWFAAAQPPPEAVYDATRAVANWLLVRTGHEPAPMSPAEADWLAASPDAQRDWLVETYPRLAACDAAAVRVPWSGR